MFIVADFVSLSSQYMVGAGVTKSVIQSSARNKHMNEWFMFFVCFWSLFCNAVLCALFNSASISLRERELVALL